MIYLTAKQFSSIWGISERRIIKLCNENRISGAVKNGMVWTIPENTLKPSDKRCNIYKYINIEKRIMIVNCEDEIKEYLKDSFDKQGFITEFQKSELNESHKYYEGLIYFSNEDKSDEQIIKHFSNKMNSESCIVFVSHKKAIEKKLVEKIYKQIGLRMNSVILDFGNNDIDVDYYDVAEDIVNMFINFKNTKGACISTDGGKLIVDNNKRTEDLYSGEFYRYIFKYFKNLNVNSYLWCASTMLEDEWTEEPQEMKFRMLNLDAANKGVKIERIFIFKKDKIKEFKNNKTLKIYMQSNINTMYVDYDEILEKNPNLLKIVDLGWDGINNETLIVDLPGDHERGYISKNTKEIMKRYNCFQELKKFSKNLKEVLK